MSGRDGSRQEHEGGGGVEGPQATRGHGRRHPWFPCDFRVSFLLLRLRRIMRSGNITVCLVKLLFSPKEHAVDYTLNSHIFEDMLKHNLDNQK